MFMSAKEDSRFSLQDPRHLNKALLKLTESLDVIIGNKIQVILINKFMQMPYPLVSEDNDGPSYL